jgi:putative glycosyltransferase (TIGR04372 family)
MQTGISNHLKIQVLVIIRKLISIIPALFVVIILRAIRPWVLVRFGSIIGGRIGHFAGNIEIYLCEQDAGINKPDGRYKDIFYVDEKKICNRQLEIMWRRVLWILPSWMISPIVSINKIIPGGDIHEIGNNTLHDQDVLKLYEKQETHAIFMKQELLFGENELLKIGIPLGSPYVCLIVRDSEYLADDKWTYHAYRDSDIQSYVLAAEELTNLGFFVVRMGAKVKAKMNSTNPRVIDYATNGSRSDFMDIYLGAKCSFCISTSTGWDAVPTIFRKPVLYVNLAPVGYLFSVSWVRLAIFKHHFSIVLNRNLTFEEIFANDLGLAFKSERFEQSKVLLIDNTPEEIRDVAVEMALRIKGTWNESIQDVESQQKFLSLFPKGLMTDLNGKQLNTDSRSRIGSAFLRKSIY